MARRFWCAGGTAQRRSQHWPGTPKARCWRSPRRMATPGCWSFSGEAKLSGEEGGRLAIPAIYLLFPKLGWFLPKLGCIIPNMGRMDMETISLSNALFSKVQQRGLSLIFGQPERSFYTSEIKRNVNSGTGAVERELSRLQRSGLVSIERIGNQKHYRANRQSPIFAELHSLVIKTVALTEPLRKSLEPYSDKIKAAFVYGSVTKGTDTARSDIDLLVIGDELSYSELYAALQNAENL